MECVLAAVRRRHALSQSRRHCRVGVWRQCVPERFVRNGELRRLVLCSQLRVESVVVVVVVLGDVRWRHTFALAHQVIGRVVRRHMRRAQRKRAVLYRLLSQQLRVGGVWRVVRLLGDVRHGYADAHARNSHRRGVRRLVPWQRNGVAAVHATGVRVAAS